jgi:hypothetical protein
MADGDPVRIGTNVNVPSTPLSETQIQGNIAPTGATRNVFSARNVGYGDGIYGEANQGGTGVRGTSLRGDGVLGTSGPFGTGVEGYTSSGTGVRGTSINGGYGVLGHSDGTGVRGTSDSGTGVGGRSTTGTGVEGFTFSGAAAVRGTSGSRTGVVGESGSGIGVQGTSITGNGVWGEANRGTGVRGSSTSGTGVEGFSSSGSGVRGFSMGGVSVLGRRLLPYDPAQPNVVAGFFDGGITVVNGPKNFQIDHPLDPENKYLLHTCIESSEMKNVYDGVAQLHENGEAWVQLPEWFEALNGHFRYQLTPVGMPAPGLHVAEEIAENRFKIAGGEMGMRVCWQITGSRRDRWAAANPFEVEPMKPEEERGRYLEPGLYDAPEERKVTMGAPEPRPPGPSGTDFALFEERLQQMSRQAPFLPTPPQPSPLPEPSPTSSSIDYARLEEEHRRQADQLRQLIEEQRQEMEEMRRQMAGPEESPRERT